MEQEEKKEIDQMMIGEGRGIELKMNRRWDQRRVREYSIIYNNSNIIYVCICISICMYNNIYNITPNVNNPNAQSPTAPNISQHEHQLKS